MSESHENEHALQEHAEEMKAREVPESGYGQQEQLAVALEKLEQDPDARTHAQESVAEAMGMPLTQEQRADLQELQHGIAAIEGTIAEGGDANIKEFLTRVLQERYSMTLEECLGAIKPRKFEYIDPTGAALREAAVWTLAKAFDVTPEQKGVSQTVEYRLKMGGDMLKALGFVLQFIPEANFLAKPASACGEVGGRLGKALERINGDEGATLYDSTREITLASLPRDAEGNIDTAATRDLLSQAGTALKAEAGESTLIAQIAEQLTTTPETVMDAVQALDARMAA